MYVTMSVCLYARTHACMYACVYYGFSIRSLVASPIREWTKFEYSDTSANEDNSFRNHIR